MSARTVNRLVLREAGHSLPGEAENGTVGTTMSAANASLHVAPFVAGVQGRAAML